MEYRPYYLAREWVKTGQNVQIIAASFSHIRTNQPGMAGASQRMEIIDGITYRWYRAPGHSGNGIGRLFNMMTFIWRLWRNSKAIAEEFEPDVVIASSTYPMDIWPAKRIAKWANAQLIYEVHDLWPLSPIELGGMSRWNPFIIWCQWAEDYAYRHADKIVSMLPKAREHMESRGMAPEKYHYVPNGIDTEEWEQNQPLPDEIRSELMRIKKHGLPLIGYAGTHGLANALDVLLDAARDSADHFDVVMVGTGPERGRLLQRVADEKINNVNMLPAIPKSSIPEFLKNIDIAFLGWHKNPLYRFGISPNKLMDYMMAGKPVVHSVKAGNDPVAESGCGITVEPGDADAVREGILTLSKMTREEWKAMGEKGRRIILAEHTYVVLARRFIELIENQVD